MKLVESSVELKGCGPRRMVELAKAGLRGLRATVAALEQEQGLREEALQLGAALWTTVFRYCMDQGALEEAYLAMRADHEVGFMLKGQGQGDAAHRQARPAAK